MPPPEGTGSRNATSSTLRGVRVLVVEDSWEVANALKHSLESMGLVVAGPVATASDAKRLATKCGPELAIVDVNLRGEMAYPLMNWLHERDIPVIVITGYGDLPKLNKVSAILHKPFIAGALRSTLQRVMGRHRSS